MSELRTYPCYRTKYADSVLITRPRQEHKRASCAAVPRFVKVIEAPKAVQKQNQSTEPSKCEPQTENIEINYQIRKQQRNKPVNRVKICTFSVQEIA